MCTPAFSDFLKELKKFTGFMVPENVRTAVNSAIKTANRPDFVIPITSSSSPIVIAITTILDNKKTSKQCSALVSSLCGLLMTYSFRDDAAQPITRKLEHCLLLVDQNCALKIIQYTTTMAEDHVFDAASMQSILSISLSLCNSPDSFVSTSAIAAVEQIMKLFTKSVFTPHKELPPEKKREIDLCISLIKGISPEIKDHSEKLAFVVFRDIVMLGKKEKPLWLRVESLKTNVAFLILVLLKESTFYNTLLNDAVNVGFKQQAPLSFFCTIFDIALTKCPKIATTIFTNFSEQIIPKKPNLNRALSFFRVVLSKDNSIITKYYSECDRDGSNIAMFIERLKDISDAYIGESVFSISLQTKTVDQISEMRNVRMTIPVEIACFFITSCYESRYGTIKTLIAKTWTDIVSIFSVAIPFINNSCVYLIMQALHFLIIQATEMELDETRASVICTFCTCLVSSKESVKQAAFETVTSLIIVCPNGFNNHWGKIIKALVDFNWVPEKFEFTQTMKDDRIVEFILALLSVCSYAREWSLGFIIQVLMANNSRFAKLWTMVEGYILLLIDDAESLDDALEAYLELLIDDFTPETEEQLLITFERFFDGRKKLPVERRSYLLDEIKQVLAEKGTTIKKGWPHLIGALSPKNFKDEVEILNLSFRCVQIICNDLLFLVDIETKMECTKLFFEFAMQKTDINVSLSSFELMWSVVSMAKTSEMWKFIFTQLVSLIGDTRSDVAQTAARTFFSLIMSNFSSFPDDVITFLPSNCFLPIISSLTVDHPDFEPTQQLAFQELAHLAHSMWAQFSVVDVFPVDFIKKLISEHESFFMRITKRETASASFQFYEELLGTTELSEEVKDYLFDSIEAIEKESIKKYNINSAIWGSWGRLIRTALPYNKDIGSIKYLKRWMNIINSLFFDLDCGSFVPPTSHITFDTLQLMFPLPPEITFVIYTFFVKCANQTKNQHLSDLALENMCIICEKRVTQDEISNLFILSKDLFHMKGARKLLLNFIERDIEIADNMVASVYNGLIELGKSDTELKEKTGKSIAKIFTRISEDEREEFMEVYKEYCSPYMIVFEKFIDKGSELFNEEIALKYSKSIVKCISSLFADIDDDSLADVYHKFAVAKTIPQAFTGKESECLYEHIIESLPDITKTLERSSKNVKESITEILMRMSTRA